jgi:hypothetical protein
MVSDVTPQLMQPIWHPTAEVRHELEQRAFFGPQPNISDFRARHQNQEKGRRGSLRGHRPGPRNPRSPQTPAGSRPPARFESPPRCGAGPGCRSPAVPDINRMNVGTQHHKKTKPFLVMASACNPDAPCHCMPLLDAWHTVASIWFIGRTRRPRIHVTEL